MTLSDQLREILRKDPRTIAEIARESGIAQPVLYRFYMGQRGLNLTTAEKLFSFYRLRIIYHDKAKK